MDRKTGHVHEVSEDELKRRLAVSDDERRTSPRLPAKLEIEVPLASWDQARRVFTTNISQGGISIECARQLDEGGAAKLRFALPGAKRALEVKGEVMWSNPEGQAGIRFQVLSLDVKKELDSWLERHALPLGNGAMFINAML